MRENSDFVVSEWVFDAKNPNKMPYVKVEGSGSAGI